MLSEIDTELYQRAGLILHRKDLLWYDEFPRATLMRAFGFFGECMSIESIDGNVLSIELSETASMVLTKEEFLQFFLVDEDV